MMNDEVKKGSAEAGKRGKSKKEKKRRREEENPKLETRNSKQIQNPNRNNVSNKKKPTNDTNYHEEKDDWPPASPSAARVGAGPRVCPN